MGTALETAEPPTASDSAVGGRVGCYPLGTLGAVAQLVARLVRNEKARGSNPLSSTKAYERSYVGRYVDLRRRQTSPT